MANLKSALTVGYRAVNLPLFDRTSSRIEVIAGVARRRHSSTEAKCRIIEESFEAGETVRPIREKAGGSIFKNPEGSSA